MRSRTAAQKLTYLRELVYQAPQAEPIYISGQSQRADGQTKILSGQPLRQAQQHFNLFPHSELSIQVCYHPGFSPRLVSIREDRKLDELEERNGSPSLTLPSSRPVRERQLLEEVGGGGSRQRGSSDSLQMTPQERRQYDWHMKKYEEADMTRNPNAERDPGESRFEIKARTAAQKQEQQVQRAKAQQRALMHAAPPNLHHMSTRQKAQSKSEASVEKRSRTPSPSHSSSSGSSSSSVPPRHLRANRMNKIFQMFQWRNLLLQSLHRKS